MNNPNTFIMGWASFAGAVFVGGYLGYRKSVKDNQQIAKDQEEYMNKVKNDPKLKQLSEEIRREKRLAKEREEASRHNIEKDKG